MARQMHWATRPYAYDRRQLDRGQVFELVGQPHDERLVRLHYAREVEKGTQLHTCDQCGGEFIGLGERAGHVKVRHPIRPRTVQEEERMLDEQERYLNKVEPIPWEKTQASQKG